MENNANNSAPGVSRRQFIKTSSLVAASAAATVSFPSVLQAQGKQPIRAVIIGLGGRGGGAGSDFLEAVKLTGADGKIVAVADLFPEQANRGTKAPFNLPADKCFSGFNAYEKVLEIPDVNYAILATPPGGSFQGVCRGGQECVYGKASGRGRHRYSGRVCGGGRS
jgi:hypothetical protein